MRLTRSTLKCPLETIESSLCLDFRNGRSHQHSIKTIGQFRIRAIMRSILLAGGELRLFVREDYFAKNYSQNYRNLRLQASCAFVAITACS